MVKINTGGKTEEYESYVYMYLIVLVMMFVTNDSAAINVLLLGSEGFT